MKTLLKIKNWFLGPKSDFALFLVLLVLLNLVGSRAFLRLDLTARNSYSLSQASKEAVKTLEEPLSIKGFFSDTLPAPYNAVSSYLKDLLMEYSGVSNRQFTYEFYDMAKAENQKLAGGYGINMIQVQEIKDNEVGFKNVYMALVLVYSDRIEVLDNLTATDGLEYKITTTMGKMISKAQTLARLSGKMTMTLYASSALGNFGITGFDKVSAIVSDAWSKTNRNNQDKIEYKTVDPTNSGEVTALVAKYGLQQINWGSGAAGTDSGSGVLGIVLEYGDRFRTIPLTLVRGIFGGYGISGLDTLVDTLAENLQTLMSNSLTVGYIEGHGEKDLANEDSGSARFSALLSDMYELKSIKLGEAEIPANIGTVVINGPKSAFTERELYRLDQFVMRGGNILLFLDPFNEITPEGGAMYGQQPVYIPNNTGLEKLLTAWGVSAEKNYVLDKTCYVARQQGTPDMPLYYVPIIGKSGLDPKNPVSRNLLDVVFLAGGEVKLTGAGGEDVKSTPIVSSSKESWLMKDNISLSPYMMQVPSPDQMQSYPLAVSLEGKFAGAYPTAPVFPDDAKQGESAETGTVKTVSHLSKAVQSGKIIIVGTSSITGSSILDEQGQQPIAVLIRNMVDSLAGNEDLIDMRTKGLSRNPLDKMSAKVKTSVNIVNLYGLPLLVALAGLYAWNMRRIRRKKIHDKYLPQDDREGGVQ